MRAPYAGKYTFCTFTGTHQDAIRKGYKSRLDLVRKLGQSTEWRMPYLPMDPADIGRKHEAIIRLNSQSGKGGIGWYVNEVFAIDMPRDLEIEFTRVVKNYANDNSVEITYSMIEDLFRSNYMLTDSTGMQLLSCKIKTGRTCSAATSNGLNRSEYLSDDSKVMGNGGGGFVHLQAAFTIERIRHEISGSGYDVLTSVTSAVQRLGIHFDVVDHNTDHWQHCEGVEIALVSTRASATFVKLVSKDKQSWGVSIHEDLVAASLQAVSLRALMPSYIPDWLNDNVRF